MNSRRKRSTVKPQGPVGPREPKIMQLVPAPSTGVVRLARVAEARRRIASGWYDRAEVRDRLVEAVLSEIRGH